MIIQCFNIVKQRIIFHSSFFRWLSHRDFLQTFLSNYDLYLKIRDEDPDLFTANDKKILDNRQIKEGAAHMLEQLDLISNGLNVMQSDTSHLGNAMNTWLMLSSSPSLTEQLKTEIKSRMEKAVTPAHILAYMVMNKDFSDLSISQKQVAMDFVEQVDDRLPPILAAYEIQDATIFPPAAFNHSIRNSLEPVKYWQFVTKYTELEPLKIFCDLAVRVLSCPPSSAGDCLNYQTFNNMVLLLSQ